MNILLHIGIGITGYLITQDPLFLVGSVVPDLILIGWNPTKKLQKWRKVVYDIIHSLFIPILLLFISPVLSISLFIHQVMDWWVHFNEWRTKIFYPFNKPVMGYKINNNKALMLSGGYDSVAILEIIKKYKYEYDYYFFDYDQSYIKEEMEAIKNVEDYYGIKVKTIKKNWGTDIKNRNILMINHLNSIGYDTIASGSRNIIPLTDKYKDSNYLSLKLLQYVMRVNIELPLVLFSKKKIIELIPKDLIGKLYSTEV